MLFRSAGNTVTNSFTYTLDTVAPTAPTLALQTDSGLSTTDKITNIGQVNLTGLEGGDKWQFDINNNGFDMGSTLDPTVTTATLATSLFSQGSNTVTILETDVAGNTVSSSPFTFTFDTVAPSAPTVALSSDTGLSGSDKNTSNGQINITGLEGGDLWQYSINGSTYNSGATLASTVTTATLAASLFSQGSNTVTILETDVAGNTVSSSPFTFTFDTVAPSAPTVALSSDTGLSNSDKNTSKIGRAHV